MQYLRFLHLQNKAVRLLTEITKADNKDTHWALRQSFYDSVGLFDRNVIEEQFHLPPHIATPNG